MGPSNRRVLFVAYAFPPVGGAGVQRVTKFIKYLPRYGWSATVLTVANPSVPLHDGTLDADIPGETVVRRARTWEPGYALKAAVADGGGRRGPARRLFNRAARRVATLLLQPDVQVLWAPRAIGEGLRLLRELPHAAIVASGPPFSSFLIGAALSRRTGLPLVLDYRDEWDLSNAYLENKRPGRASRLIQRRMQAHAVRSAGAIVATTRSSLRALEGVRHEARGDARSEVIYNGFDPEDFAPRPLARRDDDGSRYRLAYVGTLWSLTSAAPLVHAVCDLSRRRPELAGRLDLIFAGRRTPAQEQVLSRLGGLPCRVTMAPYLDHRDALDLIRSADGLCALLADLPGAGRVVPAKIFEYMAAGRPVLAISPPGELWDILSDYPGGHRLAPHDVAGISDTLARAIEGRLAGVAADPGAWDASRFDRRRQAGQLAELLDSLAGGGRMRSTHHLAAATVADR